MRRSAFLPALLLAGVFIVAKVAVIWPIDSPAQILNLLIVTGEDVLAAMLFGLVAGAALWMTQRNTEKRTWRARVTWGVIITAGAVAALYAIANVGVYRYLRTPINVRMFKLIGRLDNVRSSIAAQCGIGLI